MHKHAQTLIKLSKSCDYLEFGDVSADPCMKLIHEASLYCTDLHPSDRQREAGNEWGQWLFRLINANEHGTLEQLAKLLEYRQKNGDFRNFKTGEREHQGRPKDSAKSTSVLAPLAFAMALLEAAGRGVFVTRELLNDALFRLHNQLCLPRLIERPAIVDERIQVEFARIIAEHGEKEGQKIIEKRLRSSPRPEMHCFFSERTMDRLVSEHGMKEFILGRKRGAPRMRKT